jgi:hypothetical protein
MAFDRKKFATIGAGGNACPKVHTFVDTASAKSAIETAGYLGDVIDNLANGDLVIARGSDGVHLRAVATTSAGATGVTLANLVMD